MKEGARTDPVPLAYDSCTITATEKHHEPHVQKAPLLWTHLTTESLDALSLTWTLSQHIPGKGISLLKG